MWLVPDLFWLLQQRKFSILITGIEITCVKSLVTTLITDIWQFQIQLYKNENYWEFIWL